MRDRADNIRRIKGLALEPKEKKVYTIPKVSEKRKKQIERDNETRLLDKEVYKSIWDASPHKCQSCWASLGKEPLTMFFHHLLPKAKYPSLRHEPVNIVILCPDCHSQAETDIDKVPNVKLARDIAMKELL